MNLLHGLPGLAGQVLGVFLVGAARICVAAESRADQSNGVLFGGCFYDSYLAHSQSR